MPGFIHCSWCHGKGCVACPGEEKKWQKKEAERLEAKANRTEEQIRQSLADLRYMRDGEENPRVSLAAKLTVAMSGRDGLSKEAIDREIAAEEEALDALYDKAFPNGPTPMFTARLDDPTSMAVLKDVFGRESLEKAFGEGGGGMAEIESRLAEATRPAAGA